MKRKHEDTVPATANGHAKHSRVADSLEEDFHSGLLSEAESARYRSEYAASGPYKHAVVQPLIADDLLRSVRQEVIDNIHFTPKETDIYRIFQSGDLANLDGLPEAALSRLPSLLRLRDALYSPQFRSWISEVSGAGPVSGKKTDMAINVYKPGCHLLCHDDVIGSRRVSYILYLTDPDRPWKSNWGGALRLYPTTPKTSHDGRKLKIPDPKWTKVIPPAWNQLSFFAVQPGESFHDVEEVYHRKENDSEDDGGRVRMAISGWFHVPQEGEEGFEEGLEDKLAEQSSLQQLQARNDSLDLPQTRVTSRPIVDDEDGAEALSQEDLYFLLKYMTPQYLTPDTVEELSELFQEESSLQLANIISAKFIPALQAQIDELEILEHEDERWQTASPPHKHRYQFRQVQENRPADNKDLLGDLLNVFMPSNAFHKWLSLVTGLTLSDASFLARRFRKGLDYTLATTHEEDQMHLEWCLNLTPTKGWTKSDGDEEDGEDKDGEQGTNGSGNTAKTKGKASASEPSSDDEEVSPGGYELYMAGDDADGANDDADGSDDGVAIPAGVDQGSSSTGGGHRRVVKKNKAADPAIYKASGDDEDDGILFSNPASWNTMTIVLRDQGALRFVKYVSENAPGDRWDIIGSAPVEDDEDDEEDEEVK